MHHSKRLATPQLAKNLVRQTQKHARMRPSTVTHRLFDALPHRRRDRLVERVAAAARLPGGGEVDLAERDLGDALGPAPLLAVLEHVAVVEEDLASDLPADLVGDVLLLFVFVTVVVVVVVARRVEVQVERPVMSFTRDVTGHTQSRTSVARQEFGSDRYLSSLTCGGCHA